MKALPAALVMLMAVAAAYADKKGDVRFAPGAAASYSSKQTNDGVTVAAVAYDSDELAHTAFGKLNPNQYGVLPVLVIIQNDTAQALRLDNIEVEYIGADGRKVEATPGSDVQYLNGPRRPGPKPEIPLPIPRGKPKNPLAAWEIEGRAFAPKLLPPHESANGFFYFQTRHLPGGKLYLTGIQQAGTGKDIFYYEIPLEYHK